MAGRIGAARSVTLAIRDDGATPPALPRFGHHQPNAG
jgi:hypothetical protein